ncbi:hypothetical protein LO762_31055 [Actinocorallia sp. API 0066]|uniref:hypothetical protein n=1 Tax=Actinocorallia sp. API 0066 TaxID=2896846 RepID=UPI001E4D5E12|nr:hypothetical protein [Actinocorallia sp. API 0066]MCD0453590.1 hypothetical protein [Actinocorallia sp. API 0066]
MTPTARWAQARRRKLRTISRTVRDRAQTDPRRTAAPTPVTPDEPPVPQTA